MPLSQLADMMDVVGAVEADHPVDRWIASGIDVWPIVRVRLADGLFRQIDGLPDLASESGLRAVARRAVASSHGAARIAASRLQLGSREAVRRGSMATGGPQALFCNDGGSFLETADGPIDRHCDPLRAELRQRGVGSTLLVLGYTAPGGLPSPTRSLQPALDLRVALARLRRPRSPDLPGHADVVQQLREQGVERHLMSPGAIARAAEDVASMSRVFEHEIRRSQASLGCVVNYYSLRGMAFLLACRRAGIPSVDVQHGVQGSLHYGYARWQRLPPGGYSLLPDRFWVWSDREAAVIARWAPEGAERAVVGGNLLLRQWMDGELPGADRAVDELDGLVGSRARPVVLVALTGEETDEMVRATLETARQGPSDWFWCVRCHPTDPDSLRWIREAARMGVTNFEVERSSTLPLFALLGRADAIVTRFSSVALDGAAFGVPSVLTDRKGLELYSDLVASGSALVADQAPTSIIDALHRAMPVSLENWGTGAGAVAPDAVGSLVDLMGSGLSGSLRRRHASNPLRWP